MASKARCDPQLSKDQISPQLGKSKPLGPFSTTCQNRGWRPAITMKQILVGIQDLLDPPNPADPAQTKGYHLFIQDAAENKKRMCQQVKQYPPLV